MPRGGRRAAVTPHAEHASSKFRRIGSWTSCGGCETRASRSGLPGRRPKLCTEVGVAERRSPGQARRARGIRSAAARGGRSQPVNPSLWLALAFLVAASATYALARVAERLGRRLGVVDNPRPGEVQQWSVPRTGGYAMRGGLWLALLVGY